MYCYDEVMNTWKSCMGTAEWRIKWRMIIAVIYVTFAVAKRKPEKQFRFVRDSNHWPLRYRCSALPIKLTNQLGAGSLIGSLCFDEGTLNYQFAKATTLHWLEIIDRMLRLSFKKMRTVLKKKRRKWHIFLKKTISSPVTTQSRCLPWRTLGNKLVCAITLPLGMGFEANVVWGSGPLS